MDGETIKRNGDNGFVNMLKIVVDKLNRFVIILQMTAAEIKDKIQGRESFWVATVSERVAASRLAGALDIPYHTRSDDSGGFYVVHIKLPPKSKRKITKTT